jgi:hypothetical protein
LTENLVTLTPPQQSPNGFAKLCPKTPEQLSFTLCDRLSGFFAAISTTTTSAGYWKRSAPNPSETNGLETVRNVWNWPYAPGKPALDADNKFLQGEDRLHFIVKEVELSPNDDARKIRKLLSIARDHLGLVGEFFGSHALYEDLHYLDTLPHFD